MPCSTARTAVQVIVTVLPEPAAPRTSVCVPPVGPPSGIETGRPCSSSPTISRSAAKPVLRGGVDRRDLADGPAEPVPHTGEDRAPGSPAGDQPRRGAAHERAQRVERATPVRGQLGEVGAGLHLFAVPAPAAHARAQRRDPECPGDRAAEHRAHEQIDSERGRGPGPAQVPVVHQPDGDQADRDAEHAVHGGRRSASERAARSAPAGWEPIPGDGIGVVFLRAFRRSFRCGRLRVRTDRRDRPERRSWWLTSDGGPEGPPSV